MSWFERIFRRRHLDDDLAEELREHIEERTEQIMRLENLSRPEARQAALRAFGNPTLIQTRSREVWEWSRLETLLSRSQTRRSSTVEVPWLRRHRSSYLVDRHRR